VSQSIDSASSLVEELLTLTSYLQILDLTHEHLAGMSTRSQSHNGSFGDHPDVRVSLKLGLLHIVSWAELAKVGAFYTWAHEKAAVACY